MQLNKINAETSLRSSARSELKTIVMFSSDIVAGLLALASSYAIANLVRTALNLDEIALNSSTFSIHATLALNLTIGLLLWFRSKGHYRRRQALADQLGAIIAGSALAMLLATSIQFATIEVGSRLISYSYWVMLAGFIIGLRLGARLVLRRLGAWSVPAVVFCDASRSSEICELIKDRDEIGALVMRVLATDTLSSDALITEIKLTEQSGMVAIYAPSDVDPLSKMVVERLVLTGTKFVYSPQIGTIPNHAEVLEFPPNDTGLIDIRDPLNRPIALAAKRAADLVIALLALIALSPLLIPIVLLIRMDGGPALFRQKRIGKNGKEFECLKFRSMIINAEDRLQKMIKENPDLAAEWKAYQKLKTDPRITGVGQFIRKTNLDELPQLINILRGDMSLIGPRPMIPFQVREYGPQIEAYKRMRPGVSGLWQVNGRNATTFFERARLDAFYVRNWSLWRDFIILIRTVREVIFVRGS